MRCNSTFMRSRVIASSAPNGSSISTILGSCTSARQMVRAAACRRKVARKFLFETLSSRPSSERRSSARCRIRPRGEAFHFDRHHYVAEYAPPRQQERVWNTIPTPRCGLAIGVPSTRFRPVGGRSPAIILSRVVLPQPDGPTTTTNSPSPMVKSIGRQRGRFAVGRLIGF